jgi:hypothetical protein
VSVNEVVANHDPLKVSFYDGNEMIETRKHFHRFFTQLPRIIILILQFTLQMIMMMGLQ